MGKKGRHGRSKSRGAAALVARVSEKPAVSAPPPPVEQAQSAPEPVRVQAEEIPPAVEAPPPAPVVDVAASAVEIAAPVAEAAGQVAPKVESPSEPDVLAVVEAPEYVPPPSRPRIETPVAFAATTGLERDDASIPAVDLDSPFFADSAHSLPHAHELHEEHEERDPRLALKMTPAAARRRAQLQKYVRFAVGAASALCLAALVKVAVARNHEEPPVPRAAAVMQVAPPPAPRPVETALPVEAVPPPAEEVVAEPPPADPAAADPAAAQADPTPPPAQAEPPAAVAEQVAAQPDKAVVQPDPAAAPPTDTASEPDPKAAAKAKHASQLALERGKIADAIAAGEESVSLDPSDAEAWLILGAAYQEKGDLTNARRSFKSCLTEGKRGPKWECAQFPH